MTRRFALRRAALAALTLGLPTGAAHAYVTLDGDTSAWPSNPTYRILNRSPDVGAAASDAAVRASFSAWEVQGSTLSLREVNSGGDITVEFLSRSWPPEVGPGAAGVTYTERRGGRITDATILINNVNFDWATDGNPADADIQGVTTHEVGHALGLGHSRTREATMYWSGGDVALRDLDPDDARGIRFLYGDGGEGLVCDTCTSPDDCAPGGLCIQLEDNRAFCGTPCGQGNTCPAGQRCVELNGGQTQCVSEELFCSDDAGTGTIQRGGYCWGAAQCAAGLDCIPIPDGDALCTSECRSDRDCGGLTCLNNGEGTQGICLPAGDGQIGDPCAANTDCASLVCVPVSEDESICSDICDPNADGCPNGSACVAVDGVDGIDGLCVPSGSVPEGGDCTVERCAEGLQCFGLSEDEAVCFRTCDDRDPDSCPGGRTCMDADGDQGNLGICPPGNGSIGDQCDSGLDCGSFVCIGDGDGGGLCSESCGQLDPCPDGWRCQQTVNSGQLCFPDEGGQGGAGGGQGGAGGAQGGAGGGEGGAGGGPVGGGAGGGQGGQGGGPVGGGPVGGGPVGGQGGGLAGAGGGNATGPDGGVEGGGVVRRANDGGGDGCATTPGRGPGPWALTLTMLGLLGLRRRR